MKKITVYIEIEPLETINRIELSKSNKIGNEIIYKITETLKDIDTSTLSFDVNIKTEQI